MKIRPRKKDNMGMTLLEVIIAVSIFSIAAIVLLQGFVTSGRINKKSNLYLEATSTAQNIMEEIKSKDFEEVALAFNYPVDMISGESRFKFLNPQLNEILNGSLKIKEVLKEDGKYKDVRLFENSGGNKKNVTASVISEDKGNTYEFNPRLTGENASKYYFQMTDVKNLHETFDALIEFDGSRTSGYKKKTSTNNEEGINDYLAPNIAKLDTKTNAFLIMEKNWDEGAMKALVEQQKIEADKLWDEKYTIWKNSLVPEQDEDGNIITRPTAQEDEEYRQRNPVPGKLDPVDVYAHLKRTLYVRLSENGGIITAEAKYELNANDYVKEGGSEFERMSICSCGGTGTAKDGETCCCTYSSLYTAFYSSEADSDLRNLYIFYYPNYNSINSVKPLDMLVFENEINYPVNLYVTKQRDENSEPPVPTSIQETVYRMSLTVKEDPAKNDNANWNTNPSLYRAQTKLRTNLDYNISDFEKILERPRINQMTLTYQDKSERKVRGTSAKSVLSYNGLDVKEALDRIYTAKVSIYKQGAGEKDFPASDLVVTLDGAKEN